MPTILGHAISGAALGAVVHPAERRRVWLLGALCAVVPDADVIAFTVGIPYSHWLGHRGFSHSLAFAALLATAMVRFGFRGGRWVGRRRRLWGYLFLATASHGVLDAFTDGGHGVAFFSPIDDGRYFFPWRPIEVSPLSLDRFLTGRGAAVLASEARWVVLPSLLAAAGAWLWRRRAGDGGIRSAPDR